MGARVFFTFLVSLFIAGTLPLQAQARDKDRKSRSKKSKSGSRDKGAIADDPWAASEEEGEETGSEEDEKETKATDGRRIKKALSDQGTLSRSGRMEFDERLVKGQAAKSGAVYLFKRMPRRLPGLVPMRRSYRRRIVEPVLGDREMKPVVFSKPEEPEESQNAQDSEGTSSPDKGDEDADPDSLEQGQGKAGGKRRKAR